MQVFSSFSKFRKSFAKVFPKVFPGFKESFKKSFRKSFHIRYSPRSSSAAEGGSIKRVAPKARRAPPPMLTQSRTMQSDAIHEKSRTQTQCRTDAKYRNTSKVSY